MANDRALVIKSGTTQQIPNADTLLVGVGIDASAAGALTIGGTTATSITVGSAGITTDFPGPVTLTGDVTTVGGTTFTTDATFEGDVTFGNANTDTVTFVSKVDSDIVFTGDGVTPPAYSIQNLKDPTNAQDAATKNYVDSAVPSVNVGNTYVAVGNGTGIVGSADLTFDSANKTMTITGDVNPALVISSAIDGPFLQVTPTLFELAITDPLTPTNSTTINPTDVAVGDGTQSGNVSAGYVGVTNVGTTNTLSLTIPAGVATIKSEDGTATPVPLLLDASQVDIDDGSAQPLSLTKSTITATTATLTVDAATTVQVGGTAAVNISGAFTLPTTDGANGEVLTTDGAGNVSWASAGGGGTITGSGTATQIAYFTGATAIGSETATGSNSFTWDATNNRLGVGTAAPTDSINVVGALNAPTNVLAINTNGGANAQAAFIAQSTATTGGFLTNYPAAYTGVPAGISAANSVAVGSFGSVGSTIFINYGTGGKPFYFVPNELASVPALTVLPSGNIGVGTATPSFAIDASTGADTAIVSTTTNVNNYGQLAAVSPSSAWIMRANGSGVGSTFLGTADASWVTMQNLGGDGFKIGAVDAGDQIQLGSYEASTSTTAVRVAITDSNIVFNGPQKDYDFRVESVANANMLLVDASQNSVSVGTTGNTHTFNVGSAGAANFCVASGGRIHTYDGTAPTNGQILIGDGSVGVQNFAKATLTAGTGISITNGAGSITIAATGAAASTSVAIDMNTSGVSVGAACYVSASGVVSAASASAPAAPYYRAARVVGIASTSAVSGKVVVSGKVNATFIGGLTITAGDPVYLSLTSGQLTNDVSAFASGDAIAEVGLVTSPLTYNGTSDFSVEIAMQPKTVTVL